MKVISIEKGYDVGTFDPELRVRVVMPLLPMINNFGDRVELIKKLGTELLMKMEKYMDGNHG